MVKKFLTLSAFFFISAVQAAQPQSITWLISANAAILSSAGGSDYGENHNNTSPIENPAVQSQFNTNLKLEITHINNQSTWQFSILHYVPHWQTSSTQNDDFTAPYSYQGSHDLTSFAFNHGYNIQFNNTLLVNLHAGFAYTVLRSQTTLNGTPTLLKRELYLENGITDFNGIGPSIGLTMSKNLWGNFAFINQLDLSLIYGPIKSSSIQADNSTVKFTDNHNILVPQVDMSLALQFAQNFDSQFFSVDGGMMFKQLFNVDNTHDGASSQYQNIAFYGPFLRFSYGF